MYIFDVAGHQMAARAYNEDLNGIPLIFIHGLTDSIDFWHDLQTPTVNERWRWYSVSLPGHHPARFPRKFPFTADHLAEVTYQAIQELIGDQDFIIAGISTGGFMALDVASHYPDRVRGVLCVSGFVGGYWHGMGWVGQQVAQLGFPGKWLLIAVLKMGVWSRRVFHFANMSAVYEVGATYHVAPMLPAVIEMQHNHFRQTPMRDLYHYFRYVHTIDLTSHLARIQAPTLVIWCDKDPFIPRKQALQISENISHSKLVILERTGHFPMWENPDYHRIVTEWLESDVQAGGE